MEILKAQEAKKHLDNIQKWENTIETLLSRSPQGDTMLMLSYDGSLNNVFLSVKLDGSDAIELSNHIVEFFKKKCDEAKRGIEQL